MNYIKSIVTFPFGHIIEIPKELKLPRDLILTIKNNNSLELSFEFPIEYEKHKAFEEVESKCNQVANVISLNNKVHNYINLYSEVNWVTIEPTISEGTIQKSMSYEVSRYLYLKGCLEVLLNNNLDTQRLSNSLICFNNALKVFERDSSDISSTSIWLRNCWESLQIDLKINEHLLKSEVTKIVNNRHITNRLDFSIGYFYVHKKNDKNKMIIPLSIEECIEYMKIVLIYFVNNLDKKN